MGLDVYLYCLPENSTKDAFLKAKKDYEASYEKWWEDCPEYPERMHEAPDKEHRKMVEEWGVKVDQWKEKKIAEGNPEPVDPENGTEIEDPSQIHPKHLFRIGYWRSSYNDGGLNQVLSKLGLPDLYGIVFENGRDDDEGFYVFPNWQAALDRAGQTLADYRDARKRMKGYGVVCEEIRQINPDNAPKNNKQAMDIFLDQLRREENWDREYKEKRGEDRKKFAYSNQYGNFFFGENGPMEIVATLPGETKFLGQDEPAMYLIVKDNTDYENDYYKKALEIVIETIEYVINSGHSERFYFHWSS